MAMLTIAQISVIVATGTLPFIGAQALGDAEMTVCAAIDPCWIGEEPHLRMTVDRCGFDDTALQGFSSALWTEIATRAQADGHSTPAREFLDLPLAA